MLTRVQFVYGQIKHVCFSATKWVVMGTVAWTTGNNDIKFLPQGLSSFPVYATVVQHPSYQVDFLCSIIVMLQQSCRLYWKLYAISIGFANLLVGCCLATKSLNLNNIKWMGVGDSACGIWLLGVTSNKLVTFPRQNSIHPSGSCCTVWGM